MARVDIILQYYCQSLHYGQAHVFHSLPRLLTIFFDLAGQVAKTKDQVCIILGKQILHNEYKKEKRTKKQKSKWRFVDIFLLYIFPDIFLIIMAFGGCGLK